MDAKIIEIGSPVRQHGRWDALVKFDVFETRSAGRDLASESVNAVEAIEILSFGENGEACGRDSPRVEKNALDFSRPAPSSMSAPSAIYAVFTEDLNILKIHEAIRARFSSLLAKVPEMRERARETRNLAKCNSLSLAVAQDTERRADEEEAYAARVEDGSLWEEYANRAREFLEEYAPLASEEAKGTVSLGYEQSAKKHEPRLYYVIHSYIEVARDYIELNAYQITNTVARCPICSTPIEQSTALDEHGTFVCVCGRETIGVVRAASFRDSARIDSGAKNMYNDLGNFIKRIDAFEGKQRTRPPANLYTQLEQYLDRNTTGPSTEEIRSMPLDERGKKPGTSVDLLASALLGTHNSFYYRDVELIAHVLWGWALADLTSSGLRRQLIADYVATQRVYERHKERWSSLNVNIRLYVHLRARGYNCDISDFKTVSSKESISYHQRMIRVMFKECNLPYVPIDGMDED